MATQKVICDTDVLIEFFDEKKARHIEWTGKIIQDICYRNVKQYFGL